MEELRKCRHERIVKGEGGGKNQETKGNEPDDIIGGFISTAKIVYFYVL